MLRDMGIDVELGERDPKMLPKVTPTPTRRLEPTIHVNLDLSILIALVSDITHSPLPDTPAEADTRYVPSAQYHEWKRKRLAACKRPEEEFDESLLEENGIGKHSRALANQALQEMGRGLLHELRDRLSAVSSRDSDLDDVEFWTTPEARDRCLRIVLSKIGGPNEKQRAAALFPSAGTPVSEAEDKYWATSRYPRSFLPLVPIHVFPSPVPPPELEPPSLSQDEISLSPFFKLLARTSRDILAQEAIPYPRKFQDSPSPSPSPIPSAAKGNGIPPTAEDGLDDVEEIERAVVTKANPRLTAHTVQSMLWGAVRGWTTLTANKSSVKAMLRDIRASEGGYGWGHEPTATRARASDGEGVQDAEVVEKAAIWVVDPRSLAEGMRADDAQ